MTHPRDKTVLVVDDEPNVRLYLSSILEDAGFRVLTAEDGEQALAMVRDEKPDIISLDLIMPKKSGHKLMLELRRDRELARIPVLIVTAHARTDLGQGHLEDLRESGVISGPGTYLEKPVSPLKYVRSIERALGLEESEDATDRIALKQELDRQMQDASREDLRRALELLRKKGA